MSAFDPVGGALCQTDYTADDIAEMAHAGYTRREIRERIAAQSGVELSDDVITDWLMTYLGPCGSCHQEPGTHRMDGGRRFCADCCAGAIAYDDRENDR